MMLIFLAVSVDALPDDDGGNVGGVVGGVILALVVIVAIAAVVVVWRRRKQKTADPKLTDGTGSDSQDMLPEEERVRLGYTNTLVLDDGQAPTSDSHLYGNVDQNTTNPATAIRPPPTTDNVYGNLPSPTAPLPEAKPKPAARKAKKKSKEEKPATHKPHMYENVTLSSDGVEIPDGRDQRGQPSPKTGRDHMLRLVTGESSSMKRDDSVERFIIEEDGASSGEDLYSTYQALTSTPQFDTFQKYLLDRLASGELGYEFSKLPKGMKHPHKIGMTEENKRKNRFKALCVYDFNRVILRRGEGDSPSDYINASYIKGSLRDRQYIATQGPRANTIDDLWWMVWQEGITQIVMLTNLNEDGKDKCDKYWPGSGKSVTYGHVTVRGVEEQQRADFVTRMFTLTVHGSSGERHVTQYHYMTWPDHGVPLAASLVDYWRYVKGRTTSTVPLLVHCSAGVGRTGTFIALDIASDLKSRGRDVNVNKIVTQLREERSLMVQSEVQYKFLHEVILEAYTSRDTRVTVEQFDVIFPDTIDIKGSNSRIDKEFQMLQEMGQFAEKPKHTMATMPENLDKNRNMDALPDDNHLAYISVHLMGRNQYTNAVFMSSFRHRRGLLLTQLPLPDTVVDLWRLVDGCGVRTIVSIGSEDEERTVKGYCRYWPRNATDDFITGPYTVKLTSSNITGDHATSYHLSIVFKQTDDRPREVELLHYRNWAGEVPGDTSSLLQLVDTVKAKQTDDVTTPIIIQCIDGSARSGLFCALFDVISRVTYDNEVDVYLTAREVQRIRPQAIKTQTQYRYLYKAAQEYIRHIAVYGNADVK